MKNAVNVEIFCNFILHVQHKRSRTMSFKYILCENVTERVTVQSPFAKQLDDNQRLPVFVQFSSTKHCIHKSMQPLRVFPLQKSKTYEEDVIMFYVGNNSSWLSWKKSVPCIPLTTFIVKSNKTICVHERDSRTYVDSNGICSSHYR